MGRLEETLASLAPGVACYRVLEGEYNPRQGLAIYILPGTGAPLAQPGTVLGEALASRSGLGCTMLEGIPEKIPQGAAVVGLYDGLKEIKPDILHDLHPPAAPGEYAILLGKSALITAGSRDGLVSGIQTLAMLILRHQEEKIPAVAIGDRPARRKRGVAVELRQSEVIPAQLFQIMSFVSTFKANALELILPDAFDPGAMAKLDMIAQAFRSNGLEISVALPWLGSMFSGKRSISDTWIALKSIARMFGAARISLDDPCPAGADPELSRSIVRSIVGGGYCLPEVAVDHRLLLAAGVAPEARNCPGLSAWFRVGDPSFLPDPAFRDFPILLDVPAYISGLSSRSLDDFHACLDAAAGWCGDDGSRDLSVSFRGLGFPHSWQNSLPGAATGLILGWGKPGKARDATMNFAELLYGDAAAGVMEVWRLLGFTFPAGLTQAEERRLGEIAFGYWPEDEADMRLLTSIDWQRTVDSINRAAGMLENVANGLTRNKSTLSGPYLSLQMLAWLCRLSFLLPDLELRLAGSQDDARTGEIAAELMNSFLEWRAFLVSLQTESGLETFDMAKLDAMGTRLGYLCGERRD